MVVVQPKVEVLEEDRAKSILVLIMTLQSDQAAVVVLLGEQISLWFEHDLGATDRKL